MQTLLPSLKKWFLYSVLRTASLSYSEPAIAQRLSLE